MPRQQGTEFSPVAAGTVDQSGHFLGSERMVSLTDGVGVDSGSGPTGNRIVRSFEWSFWVAGLFLLGLGIGHSLGVVIFQHRQSARLEKVMQPLLEPSEPAVAEATRAELARTGLIGE